MIIIHIIYTQYIYAYNNIYHNSVRLYMHTHASTKQARLPLRVMNFRGGGGTCGVSRTWVLLILRYQCVISGSLKRELRFVIG